jgi:hypothetical protein
MRRGFAPGFVNYKEGCTRLASASDKVYQLLVHGRWFSPGTPASSTTKAGPHDITQAPHNYLTHWATQAPLRFEILGLLVDTSWIIMSYFIINYIAFDSSRVTL